jgi:hypothetical protein
MIFVISAVKRFCDGRCIVQALWQRWFCKERQAKRVSELPVQKLQTELCASTAQPGSSHRKEAGNKSLFGRKNP